MSTSTWHLVEEINRENHPNRMAEHTLITREGQMFGDWGLAYTNDDEGQHYTEYLERVAKGETKETILEDFFERAALLEPLDLRTL